MAWSRACFATVAALIVACSPCRAIRPGGDEGVRLTSTGSVVLDAGSTAEEYEVRDSNPILGHFISVGATTHKLLHKSGYAYGSLVGIRHSDRDQEYGEGNGRQAWFPMVIVLEVAEQGPEEGPEEVTSLYEVVLDYDPKNVAPPGLVILDARKLGDKGPTQLEILPPVPNSFLEKNRQSIMMLLGIITASGVIKFLRRGLEAIWRHTKAKRAQGDTAVPPTAAAASRKEAGNAKKKKARDAASKED